MIDVYRRIIEDLKIEPDIKEVLLTFMDTFDGTNEEEFNNLMELVIDVLSRREILKLKAEAYEKMRDAELDYQEKLMEFRREYKSLIDSGGDNVPSVYSEKSSKEQISQLT